ncbi:MAG TPA: hypothetical protein GX012_00130, partial [Acholeplasma sp.]|nr:hypothetical protein [Acholeplasma sp.]
INTNLNKVNNLKLKVSSLSPKNKLTNNLQKLDQFKVNLNKNYYYIIDKEKDRLNKYTDKHERLYLRLLENKDQKLNSLQEILKRVNPLSIMQRGFTITKNKDNKILSSIKDVNLDEEIEITFHDGLANAKILNKKE